MEKVMIDVTEFQQMILDFVLYDKVDKLFDSTVFANEDNKIECKRAMIHGMITASMMTVQCKSLVVAKEHEGEWELLDDCSNEGVYCSVCNKKVYKKDYANQKIKSKYCPNCGAKMKR